VKPVTRCPSQRLALELDAMQHAGAWQTAATGLPALKKVFDEGYRTRSSAKSHIGPWPPG